MQDAKIYLGIFGLVGGGIATGIKLFLAVGKSREEWWGLEARKGKELKLAKTRLELWKKRSKLDKLALSGDAWEEARREIGAGVKMVWRETNENLGRMSPGDAPSRELDLPPWRQKLLLYKSIGADRVIGYFLRVLYVLVLGSVLFVVGLLGWGLLDLVIYLPHGAEAVRMYVALGKLLLWYFFLLSIAAQIRAVVLREGLPSKLNDLRNI